METQRQKHSNMPPIEGWSLLPETDTYSRFCIVRFHRGQWSVKKLGVVGNSEVEAVRIAPQRYYYLLLKAGDHAWAKIYPQDVSLDGRWVLFLAAYWRDEVRGERRLEHELVVIETRTKEIFYPFRGRQEKYAQIGSPDPLERSYWFGKA